MGILRNYEDRKDMNLAALAEASAALAATRSRTAKVALLAACLRELAPAERETGVAWLAGALPGGRLGLGPSAIYGLRDVPPANAASLTIAATRARLDDLKNISGKGSAARRREAARDSVRAGDGRGARLPRAPAARRAAPRRARGRDGGSDRRGRRAACRRRAPRDHARRRDRARRRSRACERSRGPRAVPAAASTSP